MGQRTGRENITPAQLRSRSLLVIKMIGPRPRTKLGANERTDHKLGFDCMLRRRNQDRCGRRWWKNLHLNGLGSHWTISSAASFFKSFPDSELLRSRNMVVLSF